MNSFAKILVICVSLLQIQCTPTADDKEGDEISAFFGTYTGTSSNVAEGEASERDLSVTIKPWKDNGFTVQWKAVTYRADGGEKTSETSIDFYRSPRQGIFASAMRKDVFGNMVSYDPTGVDAAPYVWAGLEGDTLTVRALYIVETGEYEMHVYSRTLRDEGLELDFQRSRNGEKVTQVSAMLERVN